MLHNGRENFLIGGLICLVTGAFLTVGGLYAMGSTVGVSGIVLFIAGMSMNTQRTMSAQEIEQWQPSPEKLPDAGRVMYRVDTSLDEPIRTSILCGACGEVGWVDGKKPLRYICAGCGIILWNEEEE